jgi:hypothetical protein
MARLVYEFFRPRMSVPVVFLIGVVGQDDSAVLYRSIETDLPEDVDRAFYSLDSREALMNDDLLHGVEIVDSRTGERQIIPPTDPALLPALVHRGSHHFVYSPVQEVAGSARDAVDAERERLASKEARREVVVSFGDAMTRAVVAAYA